MAHALDSAPNGSELARLGARELNDRVAPCRPLAKRLTELKYQPDEFQPKYFVWSIAKGLKECQCEGVDIDALEYLALRLLEVPAKDFGEMLLPTDESGRLILPTDLDQTVGEWVQQL